MAPLPALPIEKGRPGPGVLAYVITSKYCDHLPLYRLEQIFARHGLHIPRTTQWDWVRDSADLLEAIASRAADEFFAALEPIARNDEPAQLKLRHAIIAHVGVITRNLDASAVYFNEWRHLSPHRRALFAKRRDEYESLFRTILREGIQSGIFAPVDEKFAALLVLSALNWTHQWYKPDGPLTAEEVGRTLADFLMNGLYRTA